MVKFWESTLILSGMIIGVGMFGIPFSFVRAGFWLGMAELTVLAAIVAAIHLLYGEVVLATKGHHRLPGYAREYLGVNASRASMFSIVLGMSGALLAYLIVGSRFLSLLIKAFAPSRNVHEVILVGVLALAAAAITVSSLQREALWNGILTGLLVLFILVLVGVLMPHVKEARLSGFSVRNAFFPYGVILFALSGAVVIPDLVDRLGRRPREVRRAIALGSLIPALLYALFAVAVVGSTGSATSEEAISGLRSVVGGPVLILGSVIGLLAIFTSFVASTEAFQAFLRFDLRFAKFPAWFIASLFPFALYLLGLKNFIVIIGLVGAVAGGIDMILIITLHHALRRRQGVSAGFFSYAGKFILFILIVLGMVYQIIL